MSRRKLEINKRHCRHPKLEKIYSNCKNAAMQLKLLRRWISKQWGINYHPGSLYDIVHGLGFSLQPPKKQSCNSNSSKNYKS